MNPSLPSYIYQEELYQIPTSVIVILNRDWEDYTAEEKTLLGRILGSVKIDIAAVQIIAQPTFSINSVSAYCPSNILIFGSHADDISPYEATTAHGFSIIKADDLAQLDDIKKKNLWLALKQMFDI